MIAVWEILRITDIACRGGPLAIQAPPQKTTALVGGDPPAELVPPTDGHHSCVDYSAIPAQSTTRRWRDVGIASVACRGGDPVHWGSPPLLTTALVGGGPPPQGWPPLRTVTVGL